MSEEIRESLPGTLLMNRPSRSRPNRERIGNLGERSSREAVNVTWNFELNGAAVRKLA